MNSWRSLYFLWLFGLALFTARRKTARINVRKVLGANTADIAALLNRGFVGLVLLSRCRTARPAWWLTDHWCRTLRIRADCLVGVPAGGCGGNPDRADHGEFSIDQGGDGQSGKQFAIGMNC